MLQTYYCTRFCISNTSSKLTTSKRLFELKRGLNLSHNNRRSDGVDESGSSCHTLNRGCYLFAVPGVGARCKYVCMSSHNVCARGMGGLWREGVETTRQPRRGSEGSYDTVRALRLWKHRYLTGRRLRRKNAIHKFHVRMRKPHQFSLNEALPKTKSFTRPFIEAKLECSHHVYSRVYQGCHPSVIIPLSYNDFTPFPPKPCPPPRRRLLQSSVSFTYQKIVFIWIFMTFCGYLHKNNDVNVAIR